jgi:uncharacterized protein (DUF1778 family)
VRPVRAEAPSRPYPLRLSPAEAEVIRRAAGVNGQGLAEFVRQAALGAAADCGLELPARVLPSPAPAVRVLTPRGIT